MNFFNPSSFISLFLISLIIPASHQENRIFIASGNVKCFDSETGFIGPFSNQGVVLYEEDPLSSEKLAEGQTDGNGQFSVSGSGGDNWSKPEPYLYFVHACGVPKCLSETKVYLDGSVGENEDLKIILGNGQEEAEDGQGNALKIETENHGNEKCESTKGPKMSSHRLYRSSSSPMIAWSSHSPLSRTYSVNDISVYTSASDYFKQRWGTAYNPYHKSQSYYYWPLHRSSRLFPVYSTHEDTRYFYQSPYYTRVPTFYPTCDYSSSANYYTYLLDSFRAVWRRWPYEHGNSYQYRTYWPWRGETRYHHRFD